jgi:hypothetical protein
LNGVERLVVTEETGRVQFLVCLMTLRLMRLNDL